MINFETVFLCRGLERQSKTQVLMICPSYKKYLKIYFSAPTRAQGMLMCLCTVRLSNLHKFVYPDSRFESIQS